MTPRPHAGWPYWRGEDAGKCSGCINRGSLGPLGARAGTWNRLTRPDARPRLRRALRDGPRPVREGVRRGMPSFNDETPGDHLGCSNRRESGPRHSSTERSLLPDVPRLGFVGYGLSDVAIHALRGERALALAKLREAEHAGWRAVALHRDFDPNLASIRRRTRVQSHLRRRRTRHSRTARPPRRAPEGRTARRRACSMSHSVTVMET